ncbi:hypothetical protein B0H13DRAFT_2333517 [Mycena leptocephala]|nr:hypothetical protein B0H13DRAFT_2333517 [Mycena leptocephala]
MSAPQFEHLKHPPAVFCVHPAAAAPQSLHTEPVFPTDHRHSTHARIVGGTQSMRAAVDMPSALLSPSLYILAGTRALAATPSRLCVYPVVFARSRMVGYCVLHLYDL